MAEQIINLDDILSEVNLIDKVSKGGNAYSMIQLVFESGGDMQMMTPDFSSAKLLKQELELSKLRAK
jgi:hypothetical protein